MQAASTDGASYELLMDAAENVAELTRPVFDQLGELGRVVMEFSNAKIADDLDITASSWQTIEPEVSRVMEAVRFLTGAGLGVVQAVTEPRRQSSMAWWTRREGKVRAKDLILNPVSDSFYDFENARWFRMPVTRDAPILTAPYFDAWGTDDVTMTAAVPIKLSDSSVAVVAADIDARVYMGAVEQILDKSLANALLDAEDRVIVTSMPAIQSGTRLAVLSNLEITTRVNVEELGWSVVKFVSHRQDDAR